MLLGMSGTVIFDLDGTLVDSRADLAEAGNAARASIGLPPLALHQIAAFVGDGVDKLIDRLTPNCDVQARDEAKAAFIARYAACCCDATRAYAGIAEALSALSAAGWSLAVATNKPLAFTGRILEACGLAGMITEVRGGDRARKPDPAELVDILTATGDKSESSWMIGDHHTDILAGRAASMRVGWCAWGIGRREGLIVDAEFAMPGEIPLAIAAHRRGNPAARA